MSNFRRMLGLLAIAVLATGINLTISMANPINHSVTPPKVCEYGTQSGAFTEECVKTPPAASGGDPAASVAPPTRLVECPQAVSQERVMCLAGPPCAPVNGQVVDSLVVETLINGTWIPTGLACRPRAQTLSIPVLVAAAVRLVPTLSMGSSPPSTGTPLVGVQTILWLNAGRGYQALPSATLLGHRVDFRAQVVSASWDFGDGSRADSVGPGVAYDMAANPCRTRQCTGYFGHTYTVSGQMRVVATPRWSGQARVDGGPWQELGAVTGPSTELALHVWSARSVLVPR